MPITDDQIAALKTKHPGEELHLLGNDHGQVVVRVPTTPEYQRFLDEVADDGTKTHALKTLVGTVVIYPAEADFWGLVNRRPGFVTAIGNEVLALAGLKAVTERKKL